MVVIFVNNDESLSKFLENPEIPNACPVCMHTIIPNCLLVS